MSEKRGWVQVPLSPEQHSLVRAAVDATGIAAATMARRALMTEVRRRLRMRGELAHAIERARASTKRRAQIPKPLSGSVEIERSTKDAP